MAERRVLRRAADDALTTPRAHPDVHRPTDLRGDFPPGFGPSRMGSSHASVLADVSTMARRRRPTPWYLTRRPFAVLALVVIVALTAWGIGAVLRGDDTDTDRVAPAVSPAAPADPRPEPAPLQGSRGDPIQVPAPPAPPPPPPAPPPTAEQVVPRTQYQEPYQRSSPAPDRQPEVGVTRTPITRAPMSVAPVPRQPPVNNSATPGDAKRGGWHF